MTLADRYGTKRRARIDLIAGISLAAALVLLGVWFVASGGLPSNAKEIEFRDIAHEIIDEENVSLTYEMTTGANNRVVCALEALSPTHAVVGLKTVEIPPSEERTRVFFEEFKTTFRATAVTVRFCWIPEV